MYNQIRAEFYKLFHTKALYLTFALILAVFGIFSIGGQQQFVVSSSSVDETWKIGETVGFLARAYSDQVLFSFPENIQIQRLKLRLQVDKAD